jgi:hypothetical protein
MKARVGTRRNSRRRPDGIDPFACDRSRCHPLAKLKAAAVRIGLEGTRTGFKLAERLFREFPELRNA